VWWQGMKDITLSLIEIFISLIVETIILGGIFTWVANKTNEKMEAKIKAEIEKIETQNTLIYKELSKSISSSRTDIISQIKESEVKL
jgi:hypothetical protein